MGLQIEIQKQCNKGVLAPNNLIPKT